MKGDESVPVTDRAKRKVDVDESCRRVRQYVEDQSVQSEHRDMIVRCVAEAEATLTVRPMKHIYMHVGLQWRCDETSLDVGFG